MLAGRLWVEKCENEQGQTLRVKRLRLLNWMRTGRRPSARGTCLTSAAVSQPDATEPAETGAQTLRRGGVDGAERRRVITEAESARRPSSAALRLTQPALPARNRLRPHSLSRRHGSDAEVGVADGAPVCWGIKDRERAFLAPRRRR